MMPVVITGVGMVTCLGLSATTTWQRFIAGDSGVGPLTSCESIPGRAAAVGAIRVPLPPVVQLGQDRVTQLAVCAAQDALQDAGLTVSKLAGRRIGIVMGCSFLGVASLIEAVGQLTAHGPQAVPPWSIPSSMSNAPAAAIAAWTHATGPVLTINTGCASGADAIGIARQLLQANVIDLALAGGVDAPLSAWLLAGFHALRVLAIDAFPPQAACRPWDAQRSGTVLGEGAGICVLERQDAARGGLPILAYHSACDPGSPVVPHAGMLTHGLREVLANQVPLGAVCVHGSGTRAGDSAEMVALHDVFGQKPTRRAAWGSKGAFGHCLAAASALDVACAVMSLRTGVVPPTCNLETPDRQSPAGVQMSMVARMFHPRTILTMAMGFGGHQAFMVLGAANDQ